MLRLLVLLVLATLAPSVASAAVLSAPRVFPYPPTVAVSPSGDWVLAYGPDVAPGPVRVATGTFPTAPTAAGVKKLDTPQGAIVVGVTSTPDGTRSVGWVRDGLDERTGEDLLAFTVASLLRGARTWTTQRLAVNAPIAGTILRTTPDGGLAAAWTDRPRGKPERVLVAVRRSGETALAPARVAHTDAADAQASATELIGDGAGGLTAVIERKTDAGRESPAGQTTGLVDAPADGAFTPFALLRENCGRATGEGRTDGGAAFALVCSRRVGAQERLEVVAATRATSGAFGPLTRVSAAGSDGYAPDLVLGPGGRVTVAWLRRPSLREGGPELPPTRVMANRGVLGGAFGAPTSVTKDLGRVLRGPQLLAGPRRAWVLLPERPGRGVVREVGGSGVRRLVSGIDENAAVDAQGRGIAGGLVDGRAAASLFRLPG